MKAVGSGSNTGPFSLYWTVPDKKKPLTPSPHGFDETMARVLRVKPEPKTAKAPAKPKEKKRKP